MSNRSAALKILVAGAAGVIGRQLVPSLTATGHEVIGATRKPSRFELIEQLGAHPILLDAFDRDRVIAVVRSLRPDVIIHEMTDLSAMDLAANARLRIEGTRNLVDAAKANGVDWMIAQSIAFAFAPGDGLADEAAPLDLDAPDASRETAVGVHALETAVAELSRGLVLRYGVLYGPGTLNAPDGKSRASILRGERIATNSVTSWLHVNDAAQSTVDAIGWPPGIVHIVDDEPAPEKVWMPSYAEIIGGPVPRTNTVGRPNRGASNAKARRQLGWTPTFPTWREGFKTALV